MTDSRADRLPWLDDTPTKASAAPARGAPRAAARDSSAQRGGRAGWIAIVLVLLLAFAAAGYWLGTRRDEAVPAGVAPRSAERQTPPSATIPLEPVSIAPAPELVPAPLNPAPVTQGSPPLAQPPAATHPATQRPSRSPAHAATLTRPDTSRPAFDDAVEEQQQVPPPSASVPLYPIPLRAGPSGRAIQFGVYLTAEQADQSWRSILARWPYLGSKPKIVLPNTPEVGKRILWRLQLRTDSQAQSLVICQRLRAAGQTCMVVY
ncbi:hypothetical protein HMF7854_13925 [Sphingomonas ginkgonis]|uniref:SPOR domain-containing protein n=1 Tax=Sphingomonas ginkgonis TaxID=2315330 RepID=A0A3R9X9C7_9SPHN|nr:hypothetical protein [Sphingomonas ginkgonis]RST31812.1 hypothetical protein HMF7854_13925 [Sphingomonas ginkgonis]